MTSQHQMKILAISSGGGHWIQLLRLRPAFEGSDITYACVRPSYAEDVPGERFVAITDATRWDRWQLLKMLFQVAWLVFFLRTRCGHHYWSSPRLCRHPFRQMDEGADYLDR